MRALSPSKSGSTFMLSRKFTLAAFSSTCTPVYSNESHWILFSHFAVRFESFGQHLCQLHGSNNTITQLYKAVSISFAQKKERISAECKSRNFLSLLLVNRSNQGKNSVEKLFEGHENCNGKSNPAV